MKTHLSGIIPLANYETDIEVGFPEFLLPAQNGFSLKEILQVNFILNLEKKCLFIMLEFTLKIAIGAIATGGLFCKEYIQLIKHHTVCLNG